MKINFNSLITLLGLVGGSCVALGVIKGAEKEDTRLYRAKEFIDEAVKPLNDLFGKPEQDLIEYDSDIHS